VARIARSLRMPPGHAAIGVLELGLLIAAGIACTRAAPSCTDEDAFTSLAPDGQHRIVARYRDCQGTAAAVYVSIIEDGRRVPNDANACVIGCPFGGCDKRTVRPLWRHGRKVTVFYPQGAELIAPKAVVDSVGVDYVSEPPAEPRPSR
jgi:hypothetical protein